jgi:hypothetical protein
LKLDDHLKRADRLRRIGFHLSAIIFLIAGWHEDGPVPPLIALACAGVLIVALKLMERRRNSRSREGVGLGSFLLRASTLDVQMSRV